MLVVVHAFRLTLAVQVGGRIVVGGRGKRSNFDLLIETAAGSLQFTALNGIPKEEDGPGANFRDKCRRDRFRNRGIVELPSRGRPTAFSIEGYFTFVREYDSMQCSFPDWMTLSGTAGSTFRHSQFGA